jgi:hypothetical protein
MAGSPFKGSYCIALRAVIAGALIAAGALAAAQGLARPISKGPRAVGVLEFDDKKKVHLIPVVIMLNGEFYDAGAYKATPVPMALQPETVYEGVRTGVSQGLFTISMAHEVLGIWTGEGKWAPTDLAPKKKSAPLAPVEEKEGPPVLHRHGADKAPAAEPAKPAPATASASAPAATPATTTASGSVSGQDAHSVNLARHEHQAEAVEPAERPTLRRGIPEKADAVSADTLKATSAWTVVTAIPAVSDAKPETPRSFHFALRQEEEQDIREKVVALAATELRKRLGLPAQTAPRRAAKSANGEPGQPKFDNVQFEAVDPSTNNEPVFILAADTRMPDKISKLDIPYHVVLAVRQDIYSEMHVLLSGISDPAHQDLQPRYDFIDVVDADGDGYGELLFRRTYDSGKAFALYRVIGNQFWPLFEGKP